MSTKKSNKTQKKKENLINKKIEKHKEPENTAPLNEWLKYYLTEKVCLNGEPWKQSTLVLCTGLDQRKVSNLMTGKTKTLEVAEIFCIALVLRLTEEEFKNLLQRFERALSPEYEKRNEIYLKWIRHYASGPKREDPNVCILNPVIQDLMDNNLPLPNYILREAL